MARPCQADHGPSPEACHLCRLYRDSPWHRAAMDALPAGAPRRGARAVPCRHRGAATGGAVRCPTCNGHVRLKLFACAVHGECTAGRAAAGTACCATCPDYDATSP